MRRQPTALAPLVNDVINELKDETRDRKIEWQIHPLPTLPCDSGLMKQVFINLLSMQSSIRVRGRPQSSRSGRTMPTAPAKSLCGTTASVSA